MGVKTCATPAAALVIKARWRHFMIGAAHPRLSLFLLGNWATDQYVACLRGQTKDIGWYWYQFQSSIFQLIPLFVALGFGVSLSTFFTLRTALKNPDVSWDRKNNPEPNQHYADKPFKVLQLTWINFECWLTFFVFYFIFEWPVPLPQGSLVQTQSGPEISGLTYSVTWYMQIISWFPCKKKKNISSLWCLM